jgi:hypothetical protein
MVAQNSNDVSLTDVDPENAEPVLKLFRPLAGRTAEGILAEATFRRVRDVRSAVTWMEAWRDSTIGARHNNAIMSRDPVATGTLGPRRPLTTLLHWCTWHRDGFAWP